MRRSAPALAITVLGAVAAWLIAGTGFANYDTAYTLVWGDDLAHGRAPDYGVPVAPTPHPLQTVAAALLSPLGADAETVVVVAAFAFLGALGALTYALGREWFGAAAGALAAVVILTREPVLSFGARAYVDIPYLVLVLGALLVEVRRPRAGAPVLWLLTAAGLLRPEAWLFAAAYALWLWVGGERRLTVLGIAAAGPVLWAGFDWATAGDPLHSLTGTQENADVLRRRTGLDEVPITVPRRIGEILREPVLLGAAVGAVVAWRRGLRLPFVAAALALAAFCVLAAAGLPILGRYLLAPATLGAVLCGAGVFVRKRGLAPSSQRGGAGARGGAAGRDGPGFLSQVVPVIVALGLLAFVPAQVDRLDRLRGALALQRDIRDDLHEIARSGLLRRSCGSITVPNHRAVPLLALWLDRPPAEIESAQLSVPDRGYFLEPASERLKRAFILDRNDPRRLDAEVPAGFALIRHTGFWNVYARC